MNKDNQILKNNLSSLLKKFAKTNVIEKFDDVNTLYNVVNLETNRIMDNKVLKSVEIDEKTLSNFEKDINYHGIVTPLLVRPINDKDFEIITGRKRLICAKKFHIENVPCIIHEFSDEDMLLYMLYSLRDDETKSAIESATICKELCKRFHYTQATLADILDMSRSQITNLIRLLKLPKKIQKDVSKGKLSYGHARALTSLNEEQIYMVLELIYSKNLSVRDTEYFVNELKSKQNYDELMSNFQKRNNLKAKITGKQLILSFKTKKDMKMFIAKK